MIKSLVAPTRSFKWCAGPLLALSSMSYASSTLTDEDRALIEQGKAMSQSFTSHTDAGLGTNPYMRQAKEEALELLGELQKTNPTVRASAQRQAKKSFYTRHTTLVFASLSLGDSGLKDALTAISGNPDAVIVLRGVPEGMNLGKGLLGIQGLAAQYKPVPNIVINPALFKKHNVTTVPTIVLLDDAMSRTNNEPSEVARVEGLSDPQWLLTKVENGQGGDHGVKGPVEDISEPDLIEVAKKKLAGIDWAEKKESAKKRFWAKQSFNELPRAPRARTRVIDPSIYISSDITTPDGTVVASKGSIINPLDIRPFTQAVVVFDPLDKKQLQWLERELQALKVDSAIQRITYIATRFDRDDGWKSYKTISDQFDSPVYLLTPDLVTRFELQHTPSVITAQGKQFVIRELGAEPAQEETL